MPKGTGRSTKPKRVGAAKKRMAQKKRKEATLKATPKPKKGKK